MAAVGTLLATIFIFSFPVIILLIDRWIPLVLSIVLGDKSRLRDDILESGICEDKRAEWAPKPPPVRNMTPEEREEAWRREEESWGTWEGIWELACRVKPQPQPQPQPQPTPNLTWRRRNELDDLADELRRELD